MLEQMNEDGLLAFTGDGKNESVMIEACEALARIYGRGIPTIKPWDINTMKQKIDLVKKLIVSRLPVILMLQDFLSLKIIILLLELKQLKN